MKVFINRFKKLQVQRDERERERKKNYRRQSTVTNIDDPGLKALTKVEADIVPPAAIIVCERVIAQLNDFKVNFTLLSNFLQAFKQIYYFSVQFRTGTVDVTVNFFITVIPAALCITLINFSSSIHDSPPNVVKD